MSPQSARTQTAATTRRSTAVAATVVLLVSAAAFWYRLADEPYFVDEGAMVYQSFYWPLFRDGRWDDYRWLMYPAFDHPPLSKYLFGWAQETAGYPVVVDTHYRNWCRWISGGITWPRPTRERLFVCRAVSAMGGLAAVAAVFLLATRLSGPWYAALAASLFAYAPVVRTHARRAMADVMTEAAVLGTLAATAWLLRSVRRGRWGQAVAALASASLSAALAPLAKLNGGLAPAAVGLTSALLLTATWRRTIGERTRLVLEAACCVLVPALAFGIFTGFNPTLTARPPVESVTLRPFERPFAMWREYPDLVEAGPIRRALYLARFRREVMREGARNFPDDRIEGIRMRLAALWQDGFGRFGPLAVREFRPGNDRLVVVQFHTWPPLSWLWGLLVIAGLATCWYRAIGELSARSPDVHLLVAIYATAILLVSAFLIPLRWDRYYLPLQSVAVLLAPHAPAACLRVWVSPSRNTA